MTKKKPVNKKKKKVLLPVIKKKKKKVLLPVIKKKKKKKEVILKEWGIKKKEKKNTKKPLKTPKKLLKSVVVKKKKIPRVKSVIAPVVETPPPILPKPRRRKKKSAKDYFTQETEDAIIQYNNEENQDIRNRLYEEKISYPLSKLIENVFNRWKFSYFETSPQDVQREALAHLVANMGKYDPNRPSKAFGHNKKSKAFSYFSVIAKNWFILLNNNNYTKFQRQVEISEERDEHTVQLHQVDKHYAQVETNEFMNIMIKFWEENVGKIFNKERDLNIANAVIELLRQSDRIESVNKKALYLYIRDISDCKTQQITKVINKMKQHHRNIHRMYLNDGDISNSIHLPA